MSILKQEKILGLDIGYETIKLIQLAPLSNGYKLIGYNEIPLKERILERDRFKNKAATANLIKDACRMAKPSAIKATKIVSALPESFVFSKTIQIPKMSEKEYGSAILTEAAQYLPIPVEQTYIDYQVLIVHPDDALVDILFVAAPKNLVDDYIEMSRLAGLELIALETKPLAVGRSVLTFHPTNEAIAILEIGSEATRISIWENKQIRLTTSITTGKNQIEHLLGNTHEINDVNLELVKLVLTSISQETINAIKYHQNRDYKPKPISEILLCGSGAKITNIDKYLGSLINIKTSIVSPSFKEIGTEFITSTGLSMWPGK